jgi:hypothetical protein
MNLMRGIKVEPMGAGEREVIHFSLENYFQQRGIKKSLANRQYSSYISVMTETTVIQN